MGAVLAFLRARAENVAAGLLAAMFVSFIIQIVSRYVLNAPVGWSVEACLTLWIWVVFWVCAFCLEDRDHVKFDIFYVAGSDRMRRAFALVSALAIVIGLVAAAPATYDYITFYKIKRSATLHIRLDYVFSIYGVFVAAVVIRYGLRAVRLLRGDGPDQPDPAHDALVGGEEIHPQ